MIWVGLTGPLLSLWLSRKESIWNGGDLGLIPRLGDRLEKEMATHSRVAWKIPWTLEPGGCSPWDCKES